MKVSLAIFNLIALLFIPTICFGVLGSMYKLDGTGIDYFGSNNEIASSSISYVSGKRQSAITTSGANGYISFGDTIDIGASPYNTAFSIVSWVYTTSTTNSCWLDKGGGTVTVNHEFGMYLNKLIFGYYTAALTDQLFSESGTTALNINNWNFIAITGTIGTGSTYRLYINGKNVPASWIYGTGNNTPPNSVSNRQIFHSGNCYWAVAPSYVGVKVDNVRYYTNALTATQIKNLYQNEKGDY